MNVLFVCSGTAGHVNPALAIANELKSKQPDVKILFIGAGRDMENKLVPQSGYELINIKMSGLMRKPSLKMVAHNIKTVKNLFLAKKTILEIMKNYKPDAVVGTGGYVCYPVIKAAFKIKVPTVIHESNVSPGIAAKMLSGIVDNVLTSFPDMEQKYKRPERVIHTGTPVLSLSNADECKSKEVIETKTSGKPLIVSFWGSLGAERMNEMMPEFIRLLIKDSKYRLIHAAGKADAAEWIKEKISKQSDSNSLSECVEIREYIDDMPVILSAADIALCRAGGVTIGEIIAHKKPSVLVPSPYVSNNEQEENARQLEKIGGAVVLEEKECNGEVLYNQVDLILNDVAKRKQMSETLSAISRPNAASDIAEHVISLAKRARCV